jgi:hypothetical protein
MKTVDFQNLPTFSALLFYYRERVNDFPVASNENYVFALDNNELFIGALLIF